MTSKKVEYIGEYNKENYKTFLLRIRKSEEEILNKLESVLNKNGYITGLILDDINEIKNSTRKIFTIYCFLVWYERYFILEK